MGSQPYASSPLEIAATHSTLIGFQPPAALPLHPKGCGRLLSRSRKPSSLISSGRSPIGRSFGSIRHRIRLSYRRSCYHCAVRTLKAVARNTNGFETPAVNYVRRLLDICFIMSLQNLPNIGLTTASVMGEIEISLAPPLQPADAPTSKTGESIEIGSRRRSRWLGAEISDHVGARV